MVRRILAFVFVCFTLHAARNRAMQQKPMAGTPLNFAHPWSRGLVAAYIFAEYSGTGTTESVYGSNLLTYGKQAANPAPWGYDIRQPIGSSYSAGSGSAYIDAREPQGSGGQFPALRLQGSGNDHVSGPDTFLPSGTQAFSFLFRVVTGNTPGSGANAQGAVFQYGTTGVSHAARGVNFQTTTSVQWFGWADDFSGTVPTMLTHQSQWVGGSYDGTTARLFYSSSPARMTQIATATPSWNTVKNGTLQIGFTPTVNTFFDGWVDYIYMWNIPVSLDQMNEITLAPFDMFATTSPNWTRYNISNFGNIVRHRAISQ